MMFVHLAPEKRVKSILRNGINRLRKHKAGINGVFAMPVMRNFFVPTSGCANSNDVAWDQSPVSTSVYPTTKPCGSDTTTRPTSR